MLFQTVWLVHHSRLYWSTHARTAYILCSSCTDSMRMGMKIVPDQKLGIHIPKMIKQFFLYTYYTPITVYAGTLSSLRLGECPLRRLRGLLFPLLLYYTHCCFNPTLQLVHKHNCIIKHFFWGSWSLQKVH